MKKPKVIVCCGSSRYCQEMAVCAWLLEKYEGAITMGLHLLPWWYPTKCTDHLAEHENVADAMDELHLRKIDLADEIFVINVDNYIGESTSRELEYAKSKNLPIRYITDDPIGQRMWRLKLEGLEMEKKRREDDTPPKETL